MNVLHIIPGLDHRQGGPAYALLGLATYQMQIGLDVRIVLGWRQGDDPAMGDQLRDLGADVVRTGPCTGPLARCADMRDVVERAVADADVVHIHAIWLQIQHEAARATLRFDKPYVFRPCGMLDPWCLAQSRLKKKIYMMLRLRRDLQNAAAIHFTTQTERRLVEPLKLQPPALVEPNGVDLSEFANLPDPEIFRRRFPGAGDRPIVLFLSRVHYKKGLDILIPAFAKADTGDAALVIAGPDDRSYMATVRQMPIDLGIADDVIFTGILRGEDRLAALAAAEFFVLSSYQENFGVAVVEALAAGLPVIISDQVNIHDEITANKVGAVTPTDVDALAEQIERFLHHPQERREMADRARPFVKRMYDWEEIAKRWVGHYERITARSTAFAG